jgi:hypothetical protein
MPTKTSRIEKQSPWDIPNASVVGQRTKREDLHLAVTCATLAPSAHNAQPWLFRVQDNEIELYADLTRALPAVDPNHRELLIGCGAALHNLVLALRYLGYDSSLEVFGKAFAPAEAATRVLLARVLIGSSVQASPEERNLFAMISQRRTSRMEFDSRSISSSFLSEVEQVARGQSAWVRPLQDEKAREAMASFVAQGNRVQIADKKFRDELSSWSSSTAQGRRDGMPGYATGASFVLTYAGQFLFRTFRFADWQARRDRNLVLEAPALLLLGTNEDSPEHWLQAGRALQAVALRASLEGIWLAFLNQPIEVTLLRSYLRKEFGMEGYPQLLIRMGYGPASAHTPRRTLDEVLIDR